jgi:hypothetical protein
LGSIQFCFQVEVYNYILGKIDNYIFGQRLKNDGLKISVAEVFRIPRVILLWNSERKQVQNPITFFII